MKCWQTLPHEPRELLWEKTAHPNLLQGAGLQEPNSSGQGSWMYWLGTKFDLQTEETQTPAAMSPVFLAVTFAMFQSSLRTLTSPLLIAFLGLLSVHGLLYFIEDCQEITKYYKQVFSNLFASLLISSWGAEEDGTSVSFRYYAWS